MGVIVTITEQSGNDLVDYQVKVVITDPQFFEECPDQKYIECYFQDGSWIPHWVEEFDPVNNKAVIWVKVPQIPANGTVKVLIKVNPTRTEDLSNPNAVFDFYDDFDDLDISDYTQVEGSWEVVEEPVESGNGVLKATASEANLIVHNTANISTQKVLRVKVRPDDNIGAPGIVFGYQNSDNFYHVRISNEFNELQILEWVGGSATKRGSTSVSISTGTWYILKAVWKDADTIEAKLYDVNGNLLATTTATMTAGFSSGKIGLRTYKPSSFDDFRIRKYVEPGPSVTVEYVSETVTYTDYFYWGMAKMLSGAIANLMQLPIKMEIYSGGNLLKTLSLKEISTITDAENKYIISVLKFEDDSNDSYQTDKQIVYVTDPNGNTRKLAESTYVFIKMAELPLLLGFEIRIPYEDTQVEL